MPDCITFAILQYVITLTLFLHNGSSTLSTSTATDSTNSTASTSEQLHFSDNITNTEASTLNTSTHLGTNTEEHWQSTQTSTINTSNVPESSSTNEEKQGLSTNNLTIDVTSTMEISTTLAGEQWRSTKHLITDVPNATESSVTGVEKQTPFTESSTVTVTGMETTNVSESSTITEEVSTQTSTSTSTITISNTSTTNVNASANVVTQFSTNLNSMEINITTSPNYVINEDEEEYPSDNLTSVEVNTNTTSTTKKYEWLREDAIKDIAYYLRAYKFNEYDRRYETKPDIAQRRYYKEFPRPPLRSLHWEVHKYCEPSFSECVEYLRKRIRYTSLKRVDDTAVIMQEQKWTFLNNREQVEQVDEECKKLRNIDNTIADPFEGPLERYQWRVTASYYMCWYTMQQIPELEHFSESCDNFAACLDSNLRPNNEDQRADDGRPYSCALYSFCPDPCCPDKHLTRLENCWNSPDNPCFESNPSGQRECAVNRSLNTDFRDIVLNRWNVTCRCPKDGYEWNSLYGMCIDVDECATGAHNCDQKLEACVNLEGSFRCACKWGHIWDAASKTCTPSAALGLIKLGRRNDSSSGNETESLFKRILKYFKRSNDSNILRPSSVTIIYSAVCTLVYYFVSK